MNGHARYAQEFLGVRCPTCGAEAGDTCTGGALHVQRRNRWHIRTHRRPNYQLAQWEVVMPLRQWDLREYKQMRDWLMANAPILWET